MGMAVRNRLDGMWLMTIVFIRPIRLATLSAKRKEAAVTICVTEKISPSDSSCNAKRS